MAEIIAVASGKGGVGKSFLSSSLSLSFAADGKKVLLVDADLGGANLHNLLGYKVPPVGLYNFLREKATLQQITTATPVGIDFIAGSGDVLGMAHITAAERIRFVDQLQNTPYDYVVMDLGAGTSYNTVDLFNQATKRIITMNSEPTSIENAYGFLKIALYRKLERFLSMDHIFADIDKKLRSKSSSYQDLDALVADVSAVDNDVAIDILNYVEAYRVGAVLNMVRFKRELNVFYGFELVLKKYMRLSIEKLGFIPYDDKVAESIRLMQPFYYNNRDSGTSSCIDDIRKQIVDKI